MFDKNIALSQEGEPFKKFQEALKALKKNKKYKKILRNLQIVIPKGSDELTEEVENYASKANTEVFVFAREEEKIRKVLKKTENLEQVHTSYINEKDFKGYSSYPLAEIVVITLANSIVSLMEEGKFIDSLKFGKETILLKDLNIKSIIREKSTLIFKLLPSAEKHNRQKLMQRYANLKRFLKAA